MSKIVSEDSLRRALAAIPEAAGLAWLDGHIDQCTRPLLGEKHIVDIDTTVKPLVMSKTCCACGGTRRVPSSVTIRTHTRTA